MIASSGGKPGLPLRVRALSRTAPIRIAKLASTFREATNRLQRSCICFSRPLHSPQDGGRGRKSEPKRGGRQNSRGFKKSRPQPSTLQDCLQQADSLNEASHPGLPGQCMRSFAALPRRSIAQTDVPACLRAVDSILSRAHDPRVRFKPTLLSDLGKLLQAHPALRSAVNRNQVIQEHISALFSAAADDPKLLTDAIDVSQLATAQLKLSYYSTTFWAKLEHSGLGGLPAREFSNVVYACAKLHQQCGAPPPSSSLQQQMWHALQAHDHRLAAEMKPQELSNICWAIAALGLAVPCDVQNALQSAMVRVAPEMSSQGVANVWWAFATLRLEMSPETCNALQPALVRVAPAMVPQEVANVWWAFATLGIEVPRAACVALQSATVRVAPAMVSQGVCNTLWAQGVLLAQEDMQGRKGAYGDEECVAVVAARLLQLHDATFRPDERVQVHSVASILGLDRRLGPQGQPLLQACREATVQCAAEHALQERGSGGGGGEVGVLHRAVLEALRSLLELSEYDILSEAAVGDGSRLVNILLQGRGVRIAVEVDGPSRFVKDAAGRAVREDGATTLRNWQLRAWGYAVLSVPVTDKTPAQLRSAEHAAWLLGELRARGSPV